MLHIDRNLSKIFEPSQCLDPLVSSFASQGSHFLIQGPKALLQKFLNKKLSDLAVYNPIEVTLASDQTVLDPGSLYRCRIDFQGKPAGVRKGLLELGAQIQDIQGHLLFFVLLPLKSTRDVMKIDGVRSILPSVFTPQFYKPGLFTNDLAARAQVAERLTPRLREEILNNPDARRRVEIKVLTNQLRYTQIKENIRDMHIFIRESLASRGAWQEAFAWNPDHSPQIAWFEGLLTTEELGAIFIEFPEIISADLYTRDQDPLDPL